MYSYKLAPGLGPADEIILKTFDIKPSHHSFIILPLFIYSLELDLYGAPL